ncbi:MAG: hypothetical protein ACJ797_23125 [Ktedonobacteraceae bacterium]
MLHDNHAYAVFRGSVTGISGAEHMFAESPGVRNHKIGLEMAIGVAVHVLLAWQGGPIQQERDGRSIRELLTVEVKE